MNKKHTNNAVHATRRNLTCIVTCYAIMRLMMFLHVIYRKGTFTTFLFFIDIMCMHAE